MGKLTKARKELLLQAAKPGEDREGRFIAPGTYCLPRYRPAQWLVEKGLARWRRNDPETCRLIATPAGLSALAQELKDTHYDRDGYCDSPWRGY